MDIYPWMETVSKTVVSSIQQAEEEVAREILREALPHIRGKIDQGLALVNEALSRTSNIEALKARYPQVPWEKVSDETLRMLRGYLAFFQRILGGIEVSEGVPLKALRDTASNIATAIRGYQKLLEEKKEEKEILYSILRDEFKMSGILTVLGEINTYLLRISSPAFLRGDDKVDSIIRQRASEIVRERMEKLMHTEELQQFYWSLKRDMQKLFGEKKFIYIPPGHEGLRNLTFSVEQIVAQNLDNPIGEAVKRLLNSGRPLLHVNRVAVEGIKHNLHALIRLGDALAEKAAKSPLAGEIARNWQGVRKTFVATLDNIMKISPTSPQEVVIREVKEENISYIWSLILLEAKKLLNILAKVSDNLLGLGNKEKVRDIWEGFLATPEGASSLYLIKVKLRGKVTNWFINSWRFEAGKHPLKELRDFLLRLYDEFWDAILEQLINPLISPALLSMDYPFLIYPATRDILNEEHKTTVYSRRTWEAVVDSIMGQVKDFLDRINGGLLVFITLDPKDFSLLGTSADANKRSCFLASAGDRGIPSVFFAKNVAVCFVYSLPLTVASEAGLLERETSVEVNEGFFNQIRRHLKPLARFFLVIENGELKAHHSNKYFTTFLFLGQQIIDTVMEALEDLGYKPEDAENTEWLMGEFAL